MFLTVFRGYPSTFSTGQGPDFTCWALGLRTFEYNAEPRLIQLDKPTKSEFIESFNG